MKINLYLIFLCVALLASCVPGTVSPPSTVPAYTPATATISAPTEPYQEYIGIIIPPLPNHLVEVSGMMFYPLMSNQMWIATIIQEGDLFMLWFEKILYHDSNGKAIIKVSDVLVLPPPEQGHGILVDQCMLEGTLDREIVVLAKWDEEVFVRRYLPNENVILAWRANQTTGKFETMPTSGIDCIAETWLGYPRDYP